MEICQKRTVTFSRKTVLPSLRPHGKLRKETFSHPRCDTFLPSFPLLHLFSSEYSGENASLRRVRIIADVSADDRIKSRSYTHLRHVLRFSALHTSYQQGNWCETVLSARTLRADKARRTWRAPSSINCFEGTRRSRERFATGTNRHQIHLLSPYVVVSVYVVETRGSILKVIAVGGLRVRDNAIKRRLWRQKVECSLSSCLRFFS